MTFAHDYILTSLFKATRKLLSFQGGLDMLPLNKIIHGDYRDAMKDIPDGSIDAIITDPPYGILNHKIETGIDIKLFMQEANRVLKDGGFLAFFGQMPTMCDWMNEAKGDFKYRDHISWVKRQPSCITLPLLRGHESILIYSKGKSSSKYFSFVLFY